MLEIDEAAYVPTRISPRSLAALTGSTQQTVERIAELEHFIREIAETTTLEWLKRSPADWIREANEVLK